VVFKFVPYDHDFPIKKQTNGATSPPAISSAGILKTSWLRKHHALLPSVVILLFQFGVDWVAGEWRKREGEFVDLYMKFKSQVSARDTKVVVVAIRTGEETVDKNELEERYQSLRKRLNIDAKVPLHAINVNSMGEVRAQPCPHRRCSCGPRPTTRRSPNSLAAWASS
jgi:hypothetical protein